MSRKLAALSILVLLVGGLFVPGAGAHTISGTTSLTIGHVVGEENQAGRRTGHVYGRLKSSAPECKDGQRVRLQVRGGVTKTDVTDSEGEYRFRISLLETERVRVSFAGSVDTSYGHSHICSKSTSRQIRLKFPGSD